jgi:hypothetical protein
MDSAGNCTPFNPTLVLLSSGQEMFFQDAAGENPLYKQYMEWAAEAFVYSSLKYSAFASLSCAPPPKQSRRARAGV